MTLGRLLERQIPAEQDVRVLQISPLSEDDRTEWETLTRRFNKYLGREVSDELYEQTWLRLVARVEIRGVAARLDGTMVGFAHYYFHTSVWGAGRCNMADLFVAPEVRRQGVATSILKWVADDAEEHGAPRLYWNTTTDNSAARALYDTLADFNGFIVYTYRRDRQTAATSANP